MQGRPVKFTRRKDLAQLEGTPRLMLRGDPKTTGCPIYRQPNFRMQQTNPTHHPYCANGGFSYTKLQNHVDPTDMGYENR
jgi:hypothetical protein